MTWQWWAAVAGLVIYSANLGLSIDRRDWPWVAGSSAAIGIYVFVLAVYQ